jgi:hypothetical protein
MADLNGSLPLELLDRGDPSFVDAIRDCRDADALAAFAEVWFADTRPDSRRLLLEYLDQPLNAYRHEGLIKRLFKKAEAAGDDEMMARFLVMFDRSVRRVRKIRPKYKHAIFTTKAEADATAVLWKTLGYRNVFVWGRLAQFHVNGSRPEEGIIHPRKTTMPQGRMVEIDLWFPSPRKVAVPDWALATSMALDWEGRLKKPSLAELPQVLKKLKTFRLFRVATRNYLRRRAWRYFRKLGKTQPERYVGAVSRALALYRDEDVTDGLALIDNWGLTHILFHNSPVLEARPGGWTIRAGRSLAELSPTPMYEDLWDQSPDKTVELLSTARSSTVRQWAIRRIEADPTSHRPGLSLEGWLGLLGHRDPAIVALAARILEGMDGLEGISVDRWVALAGSTDPMALDVLCRLIDRHVKPGQVSLEQGVTLTGARSLPVATLGLFWLTARRFDDPGEARLLLSLLEAQSSRLRPQILRWLRETLAISRGFEPAWILEFLDSRHADARAEGWSWFLAEPRASDDFEVWRKLLESPYDDVRLALVDDLETRSKTPFGPGDLRPLWASVLLNIHRGGRAKPVVVRQIVERLKRNEPESEGLLPLLAVALRSVRGPERRAALVAVVQLVESRPEFLPVVRLMFPELEWIGEPSR